MRKAVVVDLEKEIGHILEIDFLGSPHFTSEGTFFQRKHA